MYTLISRLSSSELLARQLPTLVGALVIAEIFYKWHSFLLETGGFLATWFLLDAAVSWAEKAFSKRTSEAERPQ